MSFSGPSCICVYAVVCAFCLTESEFLYGANTAFTCVSLSVAPLPFLP